MSAGAGRAGDCFAGERNPEEDSPIVFPSASAQPRKKARSPPLAHAGAHTETHSSSGEGDRDQLRKEAVVATIEAPIGQQLSDPAQLSQAASYHTPILNIHRSELELLNPIGKGRLGGARTTVVRALCRSKPVTVKVLENVNNIADIRAFSHTIELMSRIHHPNVLLYMGACLTDKDFMIITEHMDTNLESLIRRHGSSLSFEKRLRILRDCALGLNWLHCSSPPIVHGDVRLHNVLISSRSGDQLCVKICDFGVSECVPLQQQQGSPRLFVHMAPECLQGVNPSTRSDIYSFALVMWSTVTGERVFNEYPSCGDRAELYRAIVHEQLRPSINDDMNPMFGKLLQTCWKAEPEARPRCGQIVKALELILIDASIADKTGKKFWRKHFFRQDVVPWRDLKKAVFERFASKRSRVRPDVMMLFERQVKCLKSLLVVVELEDEDEEEVSLTEFGRITDWFGPFVEERDCTRFLSRIETTVSKPWFHGCISAQEAEDRLQPEPVGSYLVRFSGIKGTFTISRKGRQLTTNAPAAHTPGSLGSSPASAPGPRSDMSSLMHGVSLGASVGSPTRPAFDPLSPAFASPPTTSLFERLHGAGLAFEGPNSPPPTSFLTGADLSSTRPSLASIPPRSGLTSALGRSLQQSTSSTLSTSATSTTSSTSATPTSSVSTLSMATSPASHASSSREPFPNAASPGLVSQSPSSQPSSCAPISAARTVRHIRILHEPATHLFRIRTSTGVREYASLCELMDREELRLDLRIPCETNRRFATLFPTHVLGGY
eukprot:CAMPEP_0174248976 /NCGR_PEP_ID=MMETSP0417-20130205/43348_1 /TAXON_ID=242541 /ORGANISM="Mayorella sp, Strain BSH-02190019" /LENGTH=776 /DNA_ID=CAMNT_0015328843 /DNA_START=37 /DNA_END=2364 /DNA_ORIENTATION=+